MNGIITGRYKSNCVTNNRNKWMQACESFGMDAVLHRFYSATALLIKAIDRANSGGPLKSSLASRQTKANFRKRKKNTVCCPWTVTVHSVIVLAHNRFLTQKSPKKKAWGRIVLHCEWELLFVFSTRLLQRGWQSHGRFMSQCSLLFKRMHTGVCLMIYYPVTLWKSKWILETAQLLNPDLEECDLWKWHQERSVFLWWAFASMCETAFWPH